VYGSKSNDRISPSGPVSICARRRAARCPTDRPDDDRRSRGKISTSLEAGLHVFGHPVNDPDYMTMRCLVVDDNTYFLTAVRHMLERDGVVVDTATSGAKALERAEKGRPDTVLLDIRLGFEDSFDVAERLAEKAGTSPRADSQPMIIFISDYAEEDFADRIATSPAAGFLDKSCLSFCLSEKIRELASVRRHRSPAEVMAEYG
jgi:two-component system, NarL family, nitrate/nitrite response regulator NarL